MILIFYGSTIIYLAAAISSLIYQSTIFKYLIFTLSVALFVVSIASIISFVSLYFYEIPTHHCPFDILQKRYNFIGYPLYTTLFGGVFFGTITGLTEPFKRIKSLTHIIRSAQRRWIILSLICIVLFTAISSWPILFSSFTMKEYF